LPHRLRFGDMSIGIDYTLHIPVPSYVTAILSLRYTPRQTRFAIDENKTH